MSEHPNARANGMAANAAARIAAMALLGAATVLIARLEGERGVGIYTMLRVLPGLVGVLASAGLPGALPYFLARPPRAQPELRPTVLAIAVGAGAITAAAWAVSAPLIAPLFFRGERPLVVAVAGLAVLSQLVTTTAKAACQGEGDISGANAVLVLEEAWFLPAYLVAHAAGLGTGAALVAGLVAADTVTAGFGWARLVRRGFLGHRAPPTVPVARELASYGMRGQVGGLLNLLSLRLDFAILGAIAGPSTLGIYAVASKFAELPRVIPLSITYVLYPRLRREEPAEAARSARRLLPRAGAMTALSTVPAGLAALVLIEPVFGHEFAGATVPAIILLVGVAGDGCGAVASGYLYGSGRPGLNSLGLGAGVAVTVVLDALLIPAHRAIGAAVASSFAYLTATTVLVAIFVARVRSVPRRETVAPDAPAPLAPPRSDQLTSPQWALPRVAQGEHP